jgi:uncharacterized DUF497 family protein
MTSEFEWDKSKAESNLEKHGVSFQEASTVFNDFSAVFLEDKDHWTVNTEKLSSAILLAMRF